MPVASYYTQQIVFYAEKIKILQRKIFVIAILRMISFLGAVIGMYGYFRYGGLMIAITTLLFLIAFILLVRWNFRLNDKKLLLQKLHFINANELDIINDQPNHFSDGQQFLSDESYLNDIDVFGQRSLFHVLNRTTTSHGTHQLTTLLQKPLSDKREIEIHQEAVHLLSRQTEGRQLLTAHGLLHSEKEGNLYDIGNWLNTPNPLHDSRWVGVIRWVLPVCTTIALLYYWSTDNYIYLGSAIVISWICIGVFAKYISRQHVLLGKKQAILDQYASILKIFSGLQTGSSTLLKEFQATATSAYASIQKLSQLAGLLDQRMNMVVNIFLNSFLVYDLQCLYALEKWKLKNKDLFDQWIECVGNIETLNSLATFAYNNPDFCTPSVIEEGLVIESTGLAHPLISAGERIANDIELGKTSKLALVTGSNMSGKTTFLRTVGVNLLLAQCGAPVCAESFSFTPMHLLTAIRISDSLQLHTSYFMGELKRLQHIIQYLKSGRPALVLVDEILRGTNSDDKTHGSEEFIKKIISFHCLTLFATHDLTLSVLEQEFPGVVTNYCFESSIQNEELSFDFKLRAGIAKNKNASFLMKKMDII